MIKRVLRTAALRLSSSEAFHALAALENVEVRYYNPLNILKPWLLNYRLHDKYIIADGSAYILGGRNVNDLSLSENAAPLRRPQSRFHRPPRRDAAMEVFDVKEKQELIYMDCLTKEELDAMMEKSLTQAKAGDGLALDEALAKIIANIESI